MWSGGEWSGDKHQMQFAKKTGQFIYYKNITEQLELSNFNFKKV